MEIEVIEEIKFQPIKLVFTLTKQDDVNNLYKTGQKLMEDSVRTTDIDHQIGKLICSQLDKYYK